MIRARRSPEKVRSTALCLWRGEPEKALTAASGSLYITFQSDGSYYEFRFADYGDSNNNVLVPSRQNSGHFFRQIVPGRSDPQGGFFDVDENLMWYSHGSDDCHNFLSVYERTIDCVLQEWVCSIEP